MNAVEGHEKPATPKGTTYIILSGADGAWQKIATVTAQGADAAIKQAATATPLPQDSELVAIPERSWQPKKISIETTPRVRLS